MEKKTITVDDVIRRHIAAHSHSYYSWIRYVVTLATGSLTALISLQGQYLPISLEARWVLMIGLSAQIVTIIFGLLALREEYALPLRRAAEINDIKIKQGESAAIKIIVAGYGGIPSTLHYWCAQGMIFSFAISMVCLVFFVANNVL